MTTQRDDDQQRRTSRQAHIGRLGAVQDPTPSQRAALERLRRFEAADADTDGVHTLRRALGLDPADMPSSTDRGGNR